MDFSHLFHNDHGEWNFFILAWDMGKLAWFKLVLAVRALMAKL